MLKRDQTVFVLIDVQGKLARIMHESETLLGKLGTLIQGLRKLNIPIIWLEQYPKGLGPTADEIKQYLSDLEPISKMTFSACKNEEFQEVFHALGRHQVLVAGIESHICVYQTAKDLKEQGHEVQIVKDAISSRTLESKELGIEKMKSYGITETNVEMALFELLETAEHPEFKAISKLIK
ncbi:hydrolase [Virgibacillus sp. W0430]|uniref:hydrolase n=1 Tax=Virgibacillus sp. W0430 TaxID=3391580 RepID=UPI003F44C6D5